jgi:hypothetical protein
MPYEGDGFDQSFPPKPVELGKEYDVEIEETSRRGEGITRIEKQRLLEPQKKQLKQNSCYHFFSIPKIHFL